MFREVEGFDQAQYVWVDVLYDVFTILPPNTDLLVGHVEMNRKDGRLTLKTQSKRRDTPTDTVLKLEAFRREGRDKPRFRASVGPQSEKKNQKYRFTQDLRIWVRDDGGNKKSKKKKSGR